MTELKQLIKTPLSLYYDPKQKPSLCLFSSSTTFSFFLRRASRPWSSISWALKMVNKHFLLEHSFITLLFSFGHIHRLCFIGLDLAGIESHLGSRNDIGTKLSEQCDLTYLIRTQSVLNVERQERKKGNSHKAVHTYKSYVGAFLKRISKESLVKKKKKHFTSSLALSTDEG